MAQSRHSTGSDKTRSGTGQGSATRSDAGGAQEAKDQAQEAMGQAQDQAGKLVGQARQQATTQLASQKERAASTLGTLASALHEASRQVREQDDAMMAGYIDNAAGQLDSLSQTLNQQDIGQIIDSAGRYARRQPAVFLAGAIALGFLGARFLKSSSQGSGRGTGSTSYGSYGDMSSDYGSDSGYGSGAVGAGVGMDRGSDYGSSSSSVGIGEATGYAGAGSASRGDDWQTRSSFDSGPEGS